VLAFVILYTAGISAHISCVQCVPNKAKRESSNNFTLNGSFLVLTTGSLDIIIPRFVNHCFKWVSTKFHAIIIQLRSCFSFFIITAMGIRSSNFSHRNSIYSISQP